MKRRLYSLSPFGMSLFRQFFPKAPPDPAGDFSKENAGVIAAWEKGLGDMLQLWESELTEAIRAGNRERERDAADVVSNIERTLKLTGAFYRKWKLRE